MEIHNPINKKFVDEYDFVFSSGMIMPMTIDKSLGDTIDFVEEGVVVKLTPKPSISDPDIMLPGEDVTLFSKHLLAIQHRRREVLDLSPEEKTEQRNFFKNINESIKH